MNVRLGKLCSINRQDQVTRQTGSTWINHKSSLLPYAEGYCALLQLNNTQLSPDCTCQLSVQVGFVQFLDLRILVDGLQLRLSQQQLPLQISCALFHHLNQHMQNVKWHARNFLCVCCIQDRYAMLNQRNVEQESLILSDFWHSMHQPSKADAGVHKHSVL